MLANKHNNFLELIRILELLVEKFKELACCIGVLSFSEVTPSETAETDWVFSVLVCLGYDSQTTRKKEHCSVVEVCENPLKLFFLDRLMNNPQAQLVWTLPMVTLHTTRKEHLMVPDRRIPRMLLGKREKTPNQVLRRQKKK